MSSFDQREFACRCEWGLAGVQVLAPAEVSIVVDVLSFSTCVDIALARGVGIWPGRPGEPTSAPPGAIIAGRRGHADYSLSPASFLTAPAGLTCVLPSPNGGALTLAAMKSGVTVLTACLRNATAVADCAATIGSTFNVCPAGERWPDGSIRFAVEDWIGAGAVLRALPGRKSPEASAAARAFEQFRDHVREVLAKSVSGRELIEQGFPEDVDLASEVDISATVPRLVGWSFVAAR